MQSLTIIAEVADGIGMFRFAVAGLFASAGRRIDPVGVFVSVFTTAFGGGIIRDILLDLRPFYWLSHPQWIWMTLGLTILAPVIVRRVQRFWQRRILLWADAVGLAFFAVGSCATSDRLGHPLIVSVLIGVVTGVFGGMLRDVFCAKLPSVLSNEEPYASVAFAGCWVYLGLVHAEIVPADIALWGCCALIMIVRMASFRIPWMKVRY